MLNDNRSGPPGPPAARENSKWHRGARNLVRLCAFHHLMAIHQWGWTLTLHADGATTSVSPDGRRTLHSHGPPPTQAA